MQDWLKTIDQDQKEMQDLVEHWANINSHSYNLDGLATMLEEIKNKFLQLEKKIPQLKLQIEELQLDQQELINDQGILVKKDLGKAIKITKTSAKENAKKILLMGHMDTVFPVDSHFQSCKALGSNKLNGPGVSDLKGGIVVLLKALEKFEMLDVSDNISWQVFFNPDEEIGSPGSSKIFPELAKRNELGLIYEPSLEDGSIAFKRKGAGNFHLVIRGKATHVGREFAQGASATLACAKFINEVNKLNSPDEEIIVNFGKISAGGPLNVVPDLAILGINIRIEKEENIEQVNKSFQEAIALIEQDSGIKAELHGSFNRKAKIPNQKLEELYNALNSCAQELNLDFKKRNTGGCCDGNNLFEYGLVNIDTLGVRGGKIHSDEEFICLESLSERAKLTALFLSVIARSPQDDAAIQFKAS